MPPSGLAARPVESDHLRTCAPGRSRPMRPGCPGSGAGTTPQMIGRYPDFDVFDAQDTWDEATTRVVAVRRQ